MLDWISERIKVQTNKNKNLIKLDKKFPALNKKKKPIGRTGKQGGNYQCQKEKEHTELKREDPLKNKKQQRRPDLSSSAINLIYFILMTHNNFASEPQVEVLDVNYYENAERVNGQLAMLGFIAAIGSYLFTGQIIPGLF